MAINSSSSFFMLCNLDNFAMITLSGRISSFLRNSLRSSSPSFWLIFRSLRRMAAILARARAVVANTSHWGCTRCDLEVRISTWSPLCSLWLRGTSLWFTFAPIQWLPMSVCNEKAKSSAVEFWGMVLSSPFGVNTNISEANRLSLIVSRKSIASGWGSSRISLMVFNHFSSSPSSSLPPPSLYFQWAANPCSATSFMRSLRIWTSIHCPLLPIRVTCSAWYPLALGWLTQSRRRSGWGLYILEIDTYISKQSFSSSSGFLGSKIIRTASRSYISSKGTCLVCILFQIE